MDDYEHEAGGAGNRISIEITRRRGRRSVLAQALASPETRAMVLGPDPDAIRSRLTNSVLGPRQQKKEVAGSRYSQPQNAQYRLDTGRHFGYVRHRRGNEAAALP